MKAIIDRRNYDNSKSDYKPPKYTKETKKKDKHRDDWWDYRRVRKRENIRDGDGWGIDIF